MIISDRIPGTVSRGKGVTLGIAQPTHSWLAGQLARQWGNAEFAFVGPEVELGTAAELHDIGYSEWECRPAWNPKTGLPFSFMDLPCATRLEVWRKAFHQVLPLSRYAALFVSKHTTHLTDRHDSASSAEEERQVAQFREEAFSQQADLIAQLKKEKRFAHFLMPDQLARQQDLVAVWDTLSLYLCGAFGDEMQLDAPTGDQGATAKLKLKLSAKDLVVEVAPWPFHTPEIALHWDAKVFERAFENQADLDANFAQLKTVLLHIVVRPG
jgi:hypothetical protein